MCQMLLNNLIDFSLQNIRTNALKTQQDSRSEPNISPQKIQKYGAGKAAEADFQRIFRQILRVRTPGSEGSQQVRQVFTIFKTLCSKDLQCAQN